MFFIQVFFSTFYQNFIQILFRLYSKFIPILFKIYSIFFIQILFQLSIQIWFNFIFQVFFPSFLLELYSNLIQIIFKIYSNIFNSRDLGTNSPSFLFVFGIEFLLCTMCSSKIHDTCGTFIDMSPVYPASKLLSIQRY